MTRSGTRDAVVATGTLADVPLLNALLYVRSKRLTGVLDLRAPGRRHGWVAFHSGGVVSVSTTPTIARFTPIAYELGAIAGSTLDEVTIESTLLRRPAAELLLERGAIDAGQHQAVLEEQACRRVHHMFTYPASTPFTFRECRPSGAAADVLLDVLAPVWRALLDFPPQDRVRQVLAAIGDRPLRMVSEAVVERAGLEAEDRALCEALIGGPRSLGTLREASRLPTARLELLVFLLVMSRCAEPEGPALAASQSAEMWAVKPAAPPRKTRDDVPRPESTTTWSAGVAETPAPPPVLAVLGPKDIGVEAIRARALRIAVESPYETLGLPEDAPTEAARAAFFRLSRLWHPDRLAPQLEEVRAAVELVFARMVEAHRLLTEPSGAPRIRGQRGR